MPYASTIGSLMYAMVCTRLDIAHAVGVVSRYMSRPEKQHWEVWTFNNLHDQNELVIVDNALKCILVIYLCGRYLLITMLN